MQHIINIYFIVFFFYEDTAVISIFFLIYRGDTWHTDAGEILEIYDMWADTY